LVSSSNGRAMAMRTILTHEQSIFIASILLLIIEFSKELLLAGVWGWSIPST